MSHESSSAAPKVLVFAQQTQVGEALRELLSAEFDTSVCTESIAALLSLQPLRPSAVVLDIGCDGSQPPSIIRAIRTAYPETRVIALCTRDRPRLAAGADDVQSPHAHMLKPVDGDELISLIQRLVHGTLHARRAAHYPVNPEETVNP